MGHYGLMLALLLLALAAANQAAEPPVHQILDRVGTYVRQFEAEFALVISDEEYEQKDVVTDDRGRRQAMSRRIRSEMLFAWLPEQESWLTARNVLAVNGEPVPDSKTRIDAALASSGGEDRRTRLRRLRDEGARFNIGRVYRNFNDPTFVLQVLDPVYQSRFAFSVQGTERVNGVDTWKLSFAERASPTVVQSPTGDLPASGLAWISRSDGAVARTQLTVSDATTNTRADIHVDYRSNLRVGLWTPAHMKEHYTQLVLADRSLPGTPMQLGTRNEQIECVATYSNFRRFETSGRIVSPQP